jgi:replicative DNA helicase
MSAKPELFNADAEMALLGSLLMDPMAYTLVAPTVKAGDFYVHKNRAVFEAIEQAAHNGGVDIVAIADYLERSEKLKMVGGMPHLIELMNFVPSSVRAEQYAAIVSHYATRRTLEQAAGEIARAALDVDADIADVMARSESALASVRRVDSGKRGSAGEVAGTVLEQFNEWMTNRLEPGQTRGIPTKIEKLDEMLSGLLNGLYVLAARPSMGKTAVMLQIVEGVVSGGHHALVFIIEASKEQMMERMATGYAGVSLQEIRQGTASPEDYGSVVNALGAVADWPLTIIDQSKLTPADLLAHARREQMARAVDAIFVDGLWLMEPDRRCRDQREAIGSISREMKRIQRELGIPVVMTHQLSRACESRRDKRPILSDLRETGDVEQDGDVIMFLYREGYYDPEHAEANVMETWIRKNRLGGPAGEVAKMAWIGKTMRLGTLAPAPMIDQWQDRY